ncbi:MAG: TSCPD domain-containing protein, partial [Spirochaetia bacterium]|nr:TSCPD domain-containing protein [Spirochaetia bacterium]
GCPGNTKAIAKLLEGADAQYVVDMLKGNDCGGKVTSCADQLARGVEAALAEQPAK